MIQQNSIRSDQIVWSEILKEQEWYLGGLALTNNQISEKKLQEKEKEVLSLVAQNRSKLHCVERELSQISKQREVAHGASHQLMTFLRRNIEKQSEKVALQRFKVKAALKVYAQEQEELRKQEAKKNELCEQLNSVVQSQAQAQMQRLDQLETHINDINKRTKDLKRNSISSPHIRTNDEITYDRALKNHQHTHSNGIKMCAVQVNGREQDITLQKQQRQPSFDPSAESLPFQGLEEQEGKASNKIKAKSLAKLNEIDCSDLINRFESDVGESKVHGANLTFEMSDKLSSSIHSRGKDSFHKRNSSLSLQKLDSLATENVQKRRSVSFHGQVDHINSVEIQEPGNFSQLTEDNKLKFNQQLDGWDSKSINQIQLQEQTNRKEFEWLKGSNTPLWKLKFRDLQAQQQLQKQEKYQREQLQNTSIKQHSSSISFPNVLTQQASNKDHLNNWDNEESGWDIEENDYFDDLQDDLTSDIKRLHELNNLSINNNNQINDQQNYSLNNTVYKELQCKVQIKQIHNQIKPQIQLNSSIKQI